MDQCQKCGAWLVDYDIRYRRIKCFNPDCDYENPYCRKRWIIEHNILPVLAGVPEKERQKGKCYSPDGLRECDTCELRA